VVQRPFSAYEGSDPYVFVCYSHEDRALVYPEITRLDEAGFNIWYDEGIAPGSEWSETLARQIKHCSTFLYFITPQSVVSEHCRREVNFALEQSCSLLAVHLTQTDVPDGLSLSLSNRQGILKYEHPRASYESKVHQALRPGGRGLTQSGPSTLRLDEWTLDIGTERLTHGDDEHVLDPKELSVLLHLIDRAPEVVTTEALLSRTWPDVVVGDNVLHQVMTRLRRALGDDARHPRYIETFPKRGYRLCAEVSDPTDSSSTAPARLGSPDNRAGWRRRKTGAIFAGFVVVMVSMLGAGYWLSSAQPGAQNPERIRIAVEPFDYPPGNDPLQGYAALFRNETTHYLSRLLQPGMDLAQRVESVDFVVKGAMSSLAEGVRLFVQVEAVEPGVVVWSKTLDLPRQPTEELMAWRPQHIASLAYQVVTLHGQVSRQTQSAGAVRELVAGVTESTEIWQGLGGDWNKSLVHLRRASELDPEFIFPPMYLANMYVNRLGRRARYQEVVSPTHMYTRRVLELNQHWTWLAGWVSLHDLDYPAAAANFEYARKRGWPPGGIEFNLGLLALVQGKLDEALMRYNTVLNMGAMENQAQTHVQMTYAHFLNGDYTAAAEAADRAVIETQGTERYAYVFALALKSWADYYTGDLESARHTAELGFATFGDDEPQFAPVLALLGEDEAAREVLSHGEARWEEGKGIYLSGYFWGYFHLGDYDQALVWMRRAIEDREIGLVPALRRSPLLKPIRSDPRFAAAMARLAEIEASGTPITSVAYP